MLDYGLSDFSPLSHEFFTDLRNNKLEEVLKLNKNDAVVAFPLMDVLKLNLSLKSFVD